MQRAERCTEDETMMNNSTTDHTAVFQVVADAIRVSVSHDKIETLRGGPYTEAICAALLAECEDSAENGETSEFWGTNIDGDTWRVHVRA
jgi:hypothetical protein